MILILTLALLTILAYALIAVAGGWWTLLIIGLLVVWPDDERGPWS